MAFKNKGPFDGLFDNDNTEIPENPPGNNSNNAVLYVIVGLAVIGVIWLLSDGQINKKADVNLETESPESSI